MQIQTFGIFWAAYCGNRQELVVSVPAWQAHQIQITSYQGLARVKSVRNLVIVQNMLQTQKIKKRPRGTTIDLRYGPANYKNVTPFTDHRYSTYACLWNHGGPQNQTLEIGIGWKGKLILQASILEFHVSGPVLN